MKTHLQKVTLILITFLLWDCQSKDQKDQAQGVVQISTTELEPDDHFQNALVAFANKQYKESSSEIGLAIKSMEVIMANADETRKQSIRRSIDELQELRSNVVVDKVDGVLELNYLFARAGSALAGLHMNISKKEHFDLHGKKAGEELEKALKETENMIKKYHHRELTKTELTLLGHLWEQAKRLKRGETISPAEMEIVFKKLDEAIIKAGREIEVEYVSFRDNKKTIIHDKP
jgi:hypothetical protein